MKRILLILRKKDTSERGNKQHFTWINDCKADYEFDYWGLGITKTTLKNLKKKIDIFKPDFIYMTFKKKYQLSTYNTKDYWLPDLTNIKVPKIFVEVDTWKYDVNDSWYAQFDQVYCRCPWWNGWDNVPLFRWSVQECAFPAQAHERSGIYFFGRYNGKMYSTRRKIRFLLQDKIDFYIKYSNYWKYLQTSSALICPTESDAGDFIPMKLFEYLASGAAVITNCDLNRAGIPELEPYIIRYNGLGDLQSKLSMDFVNYHDKAIPLMRNHTHRIRYKELFI